MWLVYKYGVDVALRICKYLEPLIRTRRQNSKLDEISEVFPDENKIVRQRRTSLVIASVGASTGASSCCVH